MRAKDEDDEIEQLVTLAGKIGSAKDKDVPVLLLGIQGINIFMLNQTCQITGNALVVKK